MADVLGLMTLLVVAAALVCVLTTGGLIYALRHPPRKTYAVALARENPTEPEQAGLAGEPATVRLSDGCASPVWFVRGGREGASGGEPAPVIIVLHGFGDSRYGALTWAPLLAPFAAELVLSDLRGHGEAEGAATITGELEAADVAAVIDQVLARLGERAEHERAASLNAPPAAPRTPTSALASATGAAPPVVLFGYSRGATIAIAAGASDHRVAGVIADGPYRYWHAPVRQTMRQRRYPTEPMLTLVRTALWLAGRGSRTFDRAAHASRLACPLLVLHGRDDPFCSLEAAEAIAEAAPEGEMVVFEGCRHLDLATHEPERYRDALVRFFERIEPR